MLRVATILIVGDRIEGEQENLQGTIFETEGNLCLTLLFGRIKEYAGSFMEW